MRLFGISFPQLFPQSATPLASPGGASAPANTAAPTLTGTAQVGENWTVDVGTWTGEPSAYTVNLYDDSDDSLVAVDVGTSGTFLAAWGGLALYPGVVATNAVGDSAEAFGAPTSGVLPAEPSMATPVDGSDVTALTTSINETLAALGAASIRWEVAVVADFSTVLENATDTSTSHSFSAGTLRKYWLRAVAINAAGEVPAMAVTCFLVRVPSAQSFSAEKVTNGNFANWSGGNPSSWSVSGESGSDPEITETGGGLHGTGGNGSANHFATGGAIMGIDQSIGIGAGKTYQGGLNLQARASNTIALNISGASAMQLVATTAIVGIHRSAAIAGSAADGHVVVSDAGGARNLTYDDVTIKEITRDPLQVGLAAGTFDFEVTTPASPLLDEDVYFLFNVVDTANLNSGFWEIRLLWTGSQWRIVLASRANGTRANAIGADLGASVQAIRVVVTEDAIPVRTVYAKIAGTWTLTAATKTVALYDAATGIGYYGCEGYTVTEVRVDPNFT